MKKKIKKIDSRKGFSVIEILIALAVMGMLTLILMATQSLLNKEQKQLTSQVENSTDTIVGERFLYIDLKSLSPSFNVLQVKDDRGALFFDYYSDIPEGLFAKNQQDRIFTLLPDKNVFYILSQDNWSGTLLNFDPVVAYDVGLPPADFNLPAELIFNSVNKNSWISSQRPRFWEHGKLLFFDTNVSVRTSIPLNMVEVPLSPIFLGSVDTNTNQLVSTDSLNSFLRAPYKNIDLFFRDLPSRGGGQPIVKVRAAKFYRYYLQGYRDDHLIGSPSRLIREEYMNGKFTNPLMLSDKVGSVKFSRASILDKVIQFSIEKLRFKKATEM